MLEDFDFYGVSVLISWNF